MLLPPYPSHYTYLLKNTEIVTDQKCNRTKVAGLKQQGQKVMDWSQDAHLATFFLKSRFFIKNIKHLSIFKL